MRATRGGPHEALPPPACPALWTTPSTFPDVRAAGSSIAEPDGTTQVAPRPPRPHRRARIEPTLLTSLPPHRALLTELYEAAVAGAAPGPLTAAALESFDTRPNQRLWLFAFGKGARAKVNARLSYKP